MKAVIAVASAVGLSVVTLAAMVAKLPDLMIPPHSYAWTNPCLTQAGDSISNGCPYSATQAKLDLNGYFTTPADVAAAISATAPQKARVLTSTAGTYTWTYAVPYPAGMIPNIQSLAEYTAGSTDVINVQLDGAPTNTQAKFRVTRTAVTVVSLLDLSILSVPASPGAIQLQLQASAS